MRFSRRQCALWAPFVVGAIIHVGALASESPISDPMKLALMPLLAVPVLGEARTLPRMPVALLLTALLLSWLGDGAGPTLPEGRELPLMIAFFGLAHVAYVVLFVKVLAVHPLPRWALVYVVWWGAMVVIVGVRAGSQFIAVAVYGLLLEAAATTAARCRPLVAGGAALFLTSDTLLAFAIFVPDSAPGWFDPAVMVTYLAGQGLIVAGALTTLRSEDSPTRRFVAGRGSGLR